MVLRANLDYELMQRFTLTVLAKDGGGEETTGRVRVNVLDINDNAPLFQKEAYVGSLRENEQAIQSVARIRVRCVYKKNVLRHSTENSIMKRIYSCYKIRYNPSSVTDFKY